MGNRHTFLNLAVLALLVSVPALTSAAKPKRPSGARRRVLITFRNGAGHQMGHKRAEAIRQLGGEVHHAFHSQPLVSARLSESVIARLRRQADVVSIEEDVILHVVQSDPELPWGVDRIDAEKVWPTGNKGAGVHVAILDTGIDYDHPDLAANIAGGIYFAGGAWDEFFGKDGSTNPRAWDDENGHGTHCAGIVAAVQNGTGVVGVAPLAKLHAVRVLDSRGDGYTSDICQGLEWCADAENGIDIVSMSFGGSHTAALQNACQIARDAGVLLVAGAGNNHGGSVIYPAAYDSVIAVSAVDSSDSITSFSSVGEQIELAAPGVSILSTYAGGRYATSSGTSMACPHVTGAAALVMAADVSGVRARLQSTAVDLGAAGRDVMYGYGRVNVAQAAGVAEKPRVLTTIDISPGVATLLVHETQQFSAIGKDQYAESIDTGSITWSSNASSVGTINTEGLFTALAAGTATITATATGNVTGHATITVQETPALATIEVSPETATLEAGQTEGFTAYGTDQYGNPIDPGFVSWDSSDENVGVIDASGVFVALEAGEATITATGTGGVVGSAYVTVRETPATPTMHISDIRFDPDVRSWGRWGSWCRVSAIVQVLDRSGATVADAFVYGRWSGAYVQEVSGWTNGQGIVTFYGTRWIRNGGTFTFAVTDVAKTDWLYDPAANAETSDSITLP